jgi:hypothetical protein
MGAMILYFVIIASKMARSIRDSNVDEKNRIALLKHEENYNLSLQAYENKRMCLRCSEF